MNSFTVRPAYTALSIATILVLGGCMDASLSQSGNAPASISIQDAPGAIPEVGISITGGGVNIAETVGPGTDALVFELAVGREHQVTIDTTNFIGQRSFVLPPGGAQIDVHMLEKLFVPDLETGRVVQIDDMRGDGWLTETGLVQPYDVEVGPDGRLYVINNDSAFGNTVLIFGDLSELSTGDLIPGDESTFYRALASDADRSIIYYTAHDGTDTPFLLESRNLNGDLSGTYSDLVSDFDSVWGLAVGENGDVYVSGTRVVVETLRPAVRRFSPDSTFVPVDRIIGPDVPSSSEPEIDVLFKNGKLYVTNPSGAQSNKIVQLDATTLEPVGSFGSFPVDPSNPQPGELYGPRRFVATGNTLITVIDESSSSLHDRLVQFAPNRSNWRTYGTSGTGEGEFQFFVAF